MRALRPLSLLLVLFGLAGCTVEGTPLPRFARDADAGPRDAKPSDPVDRCLPPGDNCPLGQYCGPDFICIARPSGCTVTADCAPDDRCDRGFCVQHSRACSGESDCAELETCTRAGLCAARLTTNGTLGIACGENADCGPTGFCLSGICSACSLDSDCSGSLGCFFGACTEANPCDGDENCYAGNTCTADVCTRSTVDCELESTNDTYATATLLTDIYLRGLSICGPDIDYYRIDLAAGTGLRVAVTSSRAAATLAVRATETDGSELADLVQLSLPGTDLLAIPGRTTVVSVILEISSLDTSVLYELDVQLVPAGCAGDPLDLYGDGSQARASVVGAGTIDLVACNDDEDWLAVDLGLGDRLSATLTWDEGSAADLDLQLVGEDGAVLAESAATAGGSENISAPRAEGAGRAHLRVYNKRTPTIGVPYTLVIDRELGARIDACSDARTIPLFSGTASVTGSLAFTTDVGVPGCESFDLPPSYDRIFRLVPPGDGSVLRASVRPLENATATVAIALLDDCLDDFSDLACDTAPRAGRSASLLVPLTNDAPVYLIVSSPTYVDFVLDVSLEIPGPPANDLCINAIDVSSSTELSVSTFGAADDDQLAASSAACGAAGRGVGPDRFYQFSLASGERAALELTGVEGGFLWVGESCAMMTATCTTAATVDVGAPARVVLQPTGVANYFVAVDGPAGDYELRVIQDPQCINDTDCTAPFRCDDYRCVPVPANDTCPGDQVTLVNGRATISGSTGAANDDFRVSCTTRIGRPDVVYNVQVPAGQRRLIARITEADWDPVLAIRSPGCSIAADELACGDDLRYPDLILPEAVIENPAAGVYSIIVDAFLGEGPFTLELELVP